jgi:hypothetical protein
MAGINTGICAKSSNKTLQINLPRLQRLPALLKQKARTVYALKMQGPIEN